MGVTKDDKQHKPLIYKLYDFTKGGTDIIDQRMGFYTCKPKSPKWTLTALSYLLDTCRVNSSTVYSLNSGKDPQSQVSFSCGWKLSMELVLPFIRARPLNGLSSIIQKKMAFYLPKEADPPSAKRSKLLPAEGKNRRCIECKERAKEKGQKTKNSLPNKKMQCQKHKCQLCNACTNKIL